MKAIILLCLSVLPLVAQVPPADKIPMQPLVLPDIPKMPNEFSGVLTPATPSTSASARDVTSPETVEPFRYSSKTEVLYQRKKAGSCSLSLSTSEDSLIKVVDLAVGRLAAFLWMPANRACELVNLPESVYGIVSATGLGRKSDGSLAAQGYWKIREIDLSRPRSSERITFSISGEHPMLPADVATWNRFGSPNLAANKTDL